MPGATILTSDLSLDLFELNQALSAGRPVVDGFTGRCRKPAAVLPCGSERRREVGMLQDSSRTLVARANECACHNARIVPGGES